MAYTNHARCKIGKNVKSDVFTVSSFLDNRKVQSHIEEVLELFFICAFHPKSGDSRIRIVKAVTNAQQRGLVWH